MTQIPVENCCAWCERFIDDEVEILAIGAKFPPEVNMKEHEGKMIHLGFEGVTKKAAALISTSGSDAKKNGVDLMFMTCGEKCFTSLKATLDKEKDILDVKRI